MPAAWEREKSLFHETAGKTPADLAVFVDNKGVPALPRQHRDLRAVLHRGKFIRAGLIAEIDAFAAGGFDVAGLILIQPRAARRILQLGRAAGQIVFGRAFVILPFGGGIRFCCGVQMLYGADARIAELRAGFAVLWYDAEAGKKRQDDGRGERQTGGPMDAMEAFLIIFHFWGPPLDICSFSADDVRIE